MTMWGSVLEVAIQITLWVLKNSGANAEIQKNFLVWVDQVAKDSTNSVKMKKSWGDMLQALDKKQPGS